MNQTVQQLETEQAFLRFDWSQIAAGIGARLANRGVRYQAHCNVVSFQRQIRKRREKSRLARRMRRAARRRG